MRVHDVTRDHVVPAADDEGSFLRNFENLLQTVSCTDSPKSLIRITTPQRHVVALLLLKGNVKEHMFSITVSQNSEGLNEFQLLFYKAHCPGMIEFLGVHANDHHVVWDVPFDVDTVSRSIDYLQFRLYDDPRASFISLFCSVPGQPAGLARVPVPQFRLNRQYLTALKRIRIIMCNFPSRQFGLLSQRFIKPAVIRGRHFISF